MKIKKNIKIREEDGFYLLINLDDKSILRGYPSFFKINETAKNIIEYMRKDVLTEDIINYCFANLGMNSGQKDDILNLIEILKRMDLTDE